MNLFYYFVIFLVLNEKFAPCGASDFIVSVQTQTQEDMDTLTNAVDSSMQDSNAPHRMTLGTIEATMSRVMSVDGPYLASMPVLPTLGVLNALEWHPETDNWEITYRVSRIDHSTTAPLNNFRRILYFTSQGNAMTGDTRNQCLSKTIDQQTCLQSLATSYFVPLTNGADGFPATGDSLEYDFSGLTSTVTQQENSIEDRLTITIPHSMVRSELSSKDMHTSATGTYTSYEFGIGLLFLGMGPDNLGSGSNLILFDNFEVIENSHAQVAISKRNSYSVAKHISFWVTQVQNTDIHLITVEYLLDSGHKLTSIDASINQSPVTSAQCSAMQADIDALVDGGACATQYPLCNPQTYEQTNSDGILQVWAAYTIPVTGIPDSESSLEVNTLLLTNDTITNKPIVSTLNFKTSKVGQHACDAETVVQFNPTSHVETQLYRGVAPTLESTSGTFRIQNETDLSMPESLMTVVIGPKDDAARTYFDTYTNEKIELDFLYMSHAKDEYANMPLSVLNTVEGSTSGRGILNLDPNLVSACPVEKETQHENDPACISDLSCECITTKDWDWQVSGEMERPKSGGGYFVHEAFRGGKDFTAQADLTWLQNVFGSARPDLIQNFRDEVYDLLGINSPYARVYFVFPMFQWPDTSPLALKDQTIVSFSWSIVKESARRRRLLGLLPIVSPSLEINPTVEKIKAKTGRTAKNKVKQIKILTNAHKIPNADNRFKDKKDKNEEVSKFNSLFGNYLKILTSVTKGKNYTVVDSLLHSLNPYTHSSWNMTKTELIAPHDIHNTFHANPREAQNTKESFRIKRKKIRPSDLHRKVKGVGKVARVEKTVSIEKVNKMQDREHHRELPKRRYKMK